MLTTEELLKPRYKVIAQYPFSPHSNGEIIKATSGSTYYDQYPHLFQPLPWWSDREPGDMPEYVKQSGSFVHKVEKWEGENILAQPLYKYYNRFGNLSTFCVIDLEPATHAEYEQYNLKRR